MNIDLDRWYTEQEARELYGVTAKAFSRRLNDGRLKCVVVAKKKRLISGRAIADDLRAAEGKRQPTTPGVAS
jgi:predicted site-specific integrase-resolvase